jgi:hypothetical protein
MSNEDIEALARRAGAPADGQAREPVAVLPALLRSRRAMHKSLARVVGVGGGNGSGKTDETLMEVVVARLRRLPAAIPRGLQSQISRPGPMPHGGGKPDHDAGAGHPAKAAMVEVERGGCARRRARPLGLDSEELPDRRKLGQKLARQAADLRILCRDPETRRKSWAKAPSSSMSHDQDPADFASGDFHHVIHDEPPRYAIWRENEARTMRVAGRLYLSMTWPDDPTIPVDWIFDHIYDKGCPGPNKAKDIDWFELWTTENRNLNQQAVGPRWRPGTKPPRPSASRASRSGFPTASTRFSRIFRSHGPIRPAR